MANIDRYVNLLNLCVNELESCVSYIQQHSENKAADLEVVGDIAKHYCEVDSMHKNAKLARDVTDRHFDNQENDCTEDVQLVYQKYLATLPNKNSYENHSIWRKINSAIIGENVLDTEHLQEDDEDLDSDDNQSIDEGIVLSQFNPPTDPITKQMITNPCKNRKCGHIYEFSTIIDFLKGFKDRKSKPRCPHVGCSNTNMQSSFLIKDGELKEQIRIYLAENKSLESTSFNDSTHLTVE